MTSLMDGLSLLKKEKEKAIDGYRSLRVTKDRLGPLTQEAKESHVEVSNFTETGKVRVRGWFVYEAFDEVPRSMQELNSDFWDKSQVVSSGDICVRNVETEQGDMVMKLTKTTQ